jgi:hypothetical protein
LQKPKLKGWKMKLTLGDGEKGPEVNAILYPPIRCLYRNNRIDGSSWYAFEPNPLSNGYSNPKATPAAVLREIQTWINAFSRVASILGIPLAYDWSIKDLVRKLTAHTKRKKWEPPKRTVCPMCGQKLN